MDLNLLYLFDRIAQLGSMTKTSKALNIPKSKLSRDIRKLESQIGFELLNRSPRGVSLTIQGKELLLQIRTPLQNLSASFQVIKEKSDQLTGTIKITAPEDLSTHLLTKLIAEFMQKFPQINIELYSTNHLLDFNKYNIDLALRIGKLKDSSLIQKKVCLINIGLFATTDYLNKSPKLTQVEDLKCHQLAIFTDLFGNPMNNKSLTELKAQFTSNSLPVLKDYALQNSGVATIPTFLCKNEIRTGQIQHVLPSFTYLANPLFILSRPQKSTSRSVQLLKKFLFEKIQELM